MSKALAQEKKTNNDIIEAKEFRIVDDDGKVRARLTLNAHPKSNPTYEDKPGLYLYRLNGFVAANFGVGDDLGYLSIRDHAQSPAVELGACKPQDKGFQAGYVTVHDTRHHGATLGAWMDWDEGVGPASSVKLFKGKKPTVYWQTP